MMTAAMSAMKKLRHQAIYFGAAREPERYGVVQRFILE